MLLMPRLMLFLSRFRRNKRGMAAVEFAMVVMPFFVMLFAIIDTSLVFFASTTLENGITGAARRIRTGQAQANNMTEQQFRTLVCNEIEGLLACDARLALDVRKFTGWGNVTLPAALDNNGNLTGNFQFDPGGPNEVVVVRAFYTWPILTPTMKDSLSNMSGNHRLIVASIAFRNEPFGSILAN